MIFLTLLAFLTHACKRIFFCLSLLTESTWDYRVSILQLIKLFKYPSIFLIEQYGEGRSAFSQIVPANCFCTLPTAVQMVNRSIKCSVSTCFCMAANVNYFQRIIGKNTGTIRIPSQRNTFVTIIL